MSHIEDVKLVVLNLAALKAACAILGVEYRENQKTYGWFGTNVGNKPIPNGFRNEDLGKCDHAIHVDGVDYEVGVCKLHGRDGYALMHDAWGSDSQGGGLVKKFGTGLAKLSERYSAEVIKQEAYERGYLVSESVTSEGIHLSVEVP